MNMVQVLKINCAIINFINSVSLINITLSTLFGIKVNYVCNLNTIFF